MYTKLDTKEEIRAYTPKHVQEIILFLKKRKFNIEAFKSLTSSHYIVKVDNISCEFKTAKEAVIILQDIYEREKQVVFKEYLSRKMRALYE